MQMKNLRNLRILTPMNRIWLTVRALFSRRWWWVTLAVVAGMVLLARLGLWQLDRLDQRRAYNAQVAQALAAPPLPLTGEPLTGELTDLRNREVMVHGRFDFDEQMVLKVQNWQGQAGVHLITPLLIEGSENAAGTARAVLVDRGWIPIAEATRERWPQFEEPGPVAVHGFIALSQPLSRFAASNPQPAEPQQEWFRVDIPAIQPQLPYELLPVYVVQTPPAEGNVALPYRSEAEIDLSEGPHLGYAIQWFTFSLMLGVMYVVFVSKDRHEQAS